MRTEAIFELRRELPDLTADAFLLLIFIMFRTEGSKFVDENGNQFMTFKGKNDPKEALGLSDFRFRRAKKELTDLHLIQSVRIGFGQYNHIYVTLNGSPVVMPTTPLVDHTSGSPHKRSANTQSCGAPPISRAVDHTTASYISKTNIKTKGKDQARTASQPSRAPTTGEILQQMLEEELAKEAEAKRKEKKDDKSGGFTADDLPTEIL